MLRKITPSQVSPWEGSPVDGSHYTAEQLAILQAKRPRWASFVDRPVTLRVQRQGLWDPEPPPMVVQCPIIAWTKDRRRVLVVTPGGFEQWFDAPASFITGLPSAT